MNKLLYSALVLATFFSCAEQFTETYNIQGASSVSVLDGSKLYLKVLDGQELKSIDSCEVVHGSFGFMGRLDTVRIAMLSIRDGGMPLVMEQGDIKVTIDRMGHKVSGSPLNELLYGYMDKLVQLDNQRAELGHKEAQMMLDGIDERTIAEKLSREDQVLLMQIDSVETHFILDNLDNVLGPCAFQMLTAGFQYPVLTPQIEEIMGKASEKFKNDPYVRQYYKDAKDILARMKGELDDAPATAADPETPQP
ncbi:MAG: DUF4369 domain-containing protein [Prevotella sp.]|nr:DUF4369 domain-containing protein [Prevotella sp.]